MFSFSEAKPSFMWVGPSTTGGAIKVEPQKRILHKVSQDSNVVQFFLIKFSIWYYSIFS